jgi:hypothetical protein
MLIARTCGSIVGGFGWVWGDGSGYHAMEAVGRSIYLPKLDGADGGREVECGAERMRRARWVFSFLLMSIIRCHGACLASL